MCNFLRNVWRLGIKELFSIRFDAVLIFLIVYSFTFAVYRPAKSSPSDVKDASIAIVDEDHSALSRRMVAGFLTPYFQTPVMLTLEEIDREMDASHYTFIVDLPPHLEADVLRGRSPTVQVIVDATAMTQAGRGVGYIRRILTQEVSTYSGAAQPDLPVALVTRAKFNANLDSPPFSAVVELVNSITLLALFLSGASILREREHGTIEHLLVMPLTPSEIMLAKVWANGLVIMVGAALSLFLVIEGALGLRVAGSLPLFFVGAAIYAWALMSLGIFLGTVGRSMPQFALIAFPVFIVMNFLSGGRTRLESMPTFLQHLLSLSPSTHFMSIAQSILYRGADLGIVWRELAAMSFIGALFFIGASWCTRRTLVA